LPDRRNAAGQGGCAYCGDPEGGGRMHCSSAALAAGLASFEGGDVVRKHASLVLGAALLTLSVFAAGSPAGASGSGGARKPAVESGYHFWKTHGFLPVDGVASFYRQKAAANRWAASLHHASAPKVTNTGAAPTIGASWNGVLGDTPPDATGAVGPNSYFETVNTSVAIYDRTGGLIVTAS